MSNSFDKNKYINRQASSWEISNRYKCLELIGKGSYGQVIKGIDKSTSSFVAIKKLEIMFDEPINAKRAYREVRILRHLNHPSIVKLNDIICPLLSESLSRSKKKNEEENSLYSYLQIPRNIGSVYLIFDYIDTDLSKIIKSNQFLSDEHIQFIIYQILDGLHYIHSANVIHRDLKPANILVSCTDCTIKIADFGLARVVSSEYLQKRSDSLTENGMSFDEDQLSLKSCSLDSNINSFNELHPDSSLESNIPLPPVLKRSLTKHVVTRWYRAPEIILSQPYSSSVDLWSVGCILAELIIMLRESNIEYRKRRPLFPGDSCGDLSLDEDKFGFVQDLTKDGNKLEGNLSHEMMIELQKYQNQKCQLSIIFDVIGTPSIDEMTHFDKKTIDLVSSMRPKAKKDLKNIFPYARQECLDILEKLLQFNADKRITCVDGLNHRVFEGIKSQGYLSNYKNIPEGFSSSQMWTPNDQYSTCKFPLCSEKEKVRESQLNLKHNFVQELLAFYTHSPLL